MIKKEPAHIKSIYIPLDKYQFDHGPSDKYTENPKFIGRKAIIEKLKLLLDNDNSVGNNGAYLVTGYRGMGKTSLVREAIRRINPIDKLISKQTKLKSFEVTLSQDEVREIDLLRQIAWKVDRYIDEEIKPLEVQQCRNRYISIFSIIGAVILTLRIVNTEVLYPKLSFLQDPFHPKSIGRVLMFFGLVVFFQYLLPYVFKIISDSCYKLLKFLKRDTIVETRAKVSTIERAQQSLSKLNFELSQRLYADVTQEDYKEELSFGANPITLLTRKVIGGFSQDNQNRQSKQNYKKASPKEIEQYLFEILREIDNLRVAYKAIETAKMACWKLAKTYENKCIPAFVFIVDELDKVEPDYYFSPGDSESDKYLHHNSIPFHVETKARRRNEAISRLLANLKNFLNNSTAKFVFIGGRGMYDAALADIADRESFYSSIFNDVIYVPSFFKDKLSSQPGVSQLTEAYLCGLILGLKTDESNRNLMFLTSYLQKEYSHELNAPYKLFKVIHTLQNYVVYLTYRSNGSPKKLIELIEKNIEGYTAKPSKSQFSKSLVLPHHNVNNGLYLKLTFRDQYRINLHANIYRPYLIINSKHLKSLGDKLLYSTAFLIDHVLKFHKSAFSWRNLELIPDIILSSKDPNFRQFYSEIMSLLLNQHLRETTNAVYQYKFNSKIQNEIKFSSKISEDSSAAFNFTLDESYHLKSYFKKKLAAKYKEYGEISTFNETNEYIYSIGYLNSLIGDLHFFDEEYDDAIIHYTEVVQQLRATAASKASIRSHNSVILVRTSLSLGLCYEKTRMYDRAYSTYRSLVLLLKKIETSKSGDANTKEDAIWEKPYKRMQLFQRPHIALLNVIEKNRQDGITYDNLERNLHEYIEFLDITVPSGFFPLDGGKATLDYSDLKPNDNSPKLKIDKKRIVTLLADYYFSVGTILFFKNQIFWRLLYSRTINNVEKCENPEQISRQIIKAINTNDPFYHPSHSGYLYYLQALVTFNIPYGENIEELSKLEGCKELLFQIPGPNGGLADHLRFVTNYLQNRIYNILNSDQYDFLGNILTKLGDSILASLDKKNTSLQEAMPIISLFSEKEPDLKGKQQFEILDTELSLKTVMALYRLSYLCYRLAGKSFSAIYQYKKLLYVIRDTVDKSHRDVLDPLLLDSILKIGLEYQTDTSGVANRSQLNKYRSFTRSQDEFTSIIYNNLSNAQEVKEFVLLIETIKIKLGLFKYSNFYIGEYSTISSMFIRVVELKFKGDQDRHRIKDMMMGLNTNNFILKHLSPLTNEELYSDLKFYLANAYFCYYETLRVLNTYGVNYILNHSFKASICYRLAQICEILKEVETVGQAIKYGNNELITVCDELAELIGQNFRYSIDAFEYYDMARIHYKQAVDMHREGAVYKEMAKEMYVLEDDFNDNLVHFCAANERYRINTGKLQNRLWEINDILNNSKIYKPINYVT